MILDPIIDKAFKSSFPLRHDGEPNMPYYDPDDFGVKSIPFSFISGKNKLVGGKYFIDVPAKGVVVFHHGAFAGRRAYGDLISRFAKQGYIVYAYDNTGCCQSEGRDCVGIAQPLLDQKAFFEFLEKDESIRGLPRYTAGHSWGGYTALGGLKEEYHVDKVVCISGFNSVFDMAMSTLPKNKLLAMAVKGYLKRKFGPLGLYDGLEEMKKTNKEVLVLFGDLDKMVDYNHYFLRYQKECAENAHVHFLCAEGRGHQAFWDKKSQVYYEEFQNKMREAYRNSLPLPVFDYSKTDFDKDILQSIFDFLG